MEKLYLDSCVWLNLFKKEEPYWRASKELLNIAMFSREYIIIYSKIVLREVDFVLKNDLLFKESRAFIENEKSFEFAKIFEEDYFMARSLEKENNFGISFFDCLHIAICKRIGARLITRDKKLIEIAQKHVLVSKPEEIL